MDGTGSMNSLLSKAKYTVNEMYKNVQQILIKENIDQRSICFTED